MPRHSDRPPLARPRSGGLRNVICVSITSLRTRAGFSCFLCLFRLFFPSAAVFSLSSYFRSSCIVSLASLATPTRRPFSSSIRSRPPHAVVEGNLCVSARQCSKTFMYLLSDDNKRRCGARSAGVMSLARISRRSCRR